MVVSVRDASDSWVVVGLGIQVLASSSELHQNI